MSAMANIVSGGGLYLSDRSGSGPMEAFARNKSKLNTKSPRGRGLLISVAFGPATAWPGTCRFFFCPVGFDSFKRNQRNQKLRHFNGGEHSRVAEPAIYFLAPGGGQKFCRCDGRTGRPGARTFSAISEIFFLQGRGGTASSLRKIAAKFRVGG